MTTRTQLEETLAAQRARRCSIHHPAPHKKGGGLISALAVAAILIVSGVAMFFAVSVTNPMMNVTAITFPSVSPSASPSPTSTMVPATPAAMKVCTDIPNGRLHVRFAAGDGSEVRGYLIEGETVQLALAAGGKMIQGELWLPIASPIAGWVNARFVCKQEK